MAHALYRKSNGELIGWIDPPDHLLQATIENLPDWQGLAKNAGELDANLYYHDLAADTVLERPVMTAELSHAGNTITIDNLPIPCSITVDGTPYEMTDPEDTTFEWVAVMAGTYEIVVESWPYQEKRWEVTV